VSPTQPTGVDTVHGFLAQGLRQLGYEASFLTADMPSPKDVFFQPLHHLRPLPSASRILAPRGRDWARRKQAHIQRQYLQFLQNRSPCAFVCGHLTYLQPMELPGVTQVGVIHAPDTPNLQRWRRFRETWRPVVAVSEACREHVLADDPSAAVSCVPNGVSIPQDLPDKASTGPLKIIWCGRIEDQQKRASDLPPLARELIRRDIDFELQVIGDGPLRDKLKAECADLSERVRLTGALSRKEVWGHMTRAHIILMTSNYEGTPMTLLEAMARGCVPVVTDGVGGLLEFLRSAVPDNIVPIGDMGQMASLIIKLAQDAQLRASQSRQIREALSLSCYTDLAMAKGYLAAIEQTMQ